MEGLIAQGLVKRFRNRLVVDGVSLDIHRGEVVGLLGPNGAGKTTSFYMIVGLLRPEGGRIFLEGQEITDLPMYLRCRKGMGYLPQESSVFRKLTVEENLLAILETMDLSAQERAARLRVLLAELDLTLRGPGDLLGDLQAGLPPLKLANLADTLMLKRARSITQQLIDRAQTDPILRATIRSILEEGDGSSAGTS